MTTECSVFSPCGRYRVHFETNHETKLRVDVFAHPPRRRDGRRDGQTSQHPGQCATHYAAVLEEPQVLELTTAAGVRKSFRNFSEMMYNALIGRAACVRFYVESYREMKARIAADVRRQQRLSAGGPALPHALCGAACADEAKRRGEDDDAASLVDLSASAGEEDLAEAILTQRFLTVDYDVDFTRAVFPIPLDPAIKDDRRGTRDLQPSPRGAITEASRDGASSQDADRMERERAHCRTVAALQEENDRLRAENEALVQLSKEKMLEMQRLCEDFQSRVQAGTEADRLRAKNAELRVRLQRAEEAAAAAERSLEAERTAHRRCGTGSSRDRSRLGSRMPSVSSSSSPRPAKEGGGRHARQGSSPNPYLRSLSHGSRCSEDVAPSRGRRAAVVRERRPLVSPTPPLSHARRSRSRATNRFDTPPPSHVSPSLPQQTRRQAARQRSRSRDSGPGAGAGGGDVPAPRGRSGNRAWEAERQHHHLSQKLARRSGSGVVSEGEKEDRSLLGGRVSSRASSVRSRGSAASATSTSSHERLFHASTAASRSRQVPHAAAASVFDTPPRRAVFR